MLDAIYSHIRDKTQTKNFSPFTFSRHLATMLASGLKNTMEKTVYSLVFYAKLYLYIFKKNNYGLQRLTKTTTSYPFSFVLTSFSGLEYLN